MTPDIFDSLADINVPPPPERFDRQLHERVNKTLVAVQVVDLVIHGMPWAMLHFARAVLGLFTLTVSGQHLPDESRERDR